MRTRASLIIVFTLLALPLFHPTVVRAQFSLTDETVFSYQLDSFELTAPFVAGGHLIDEFDDGDLSPWETRGFGTAVEAGGVVTLSNPAVADDWAPFRLVTLHRTDIFAPASFGVQAGYGSFEAKATWLTLPEAPSGFYGITLAYIVPGTWDSETMAGTLRVFSVVFSNLSSSLASAIADQPTSGGLAINLTTGLVGGVGAGNLQTEEKLELDGESSPIDALEATGPIVLKMLYDDDLQQISAAVSVDGGVTFHTPLAPRAASLPTDLGSANFELIADPPTLAGDCAAAPRNCEPAGKSSIKVDKGKLNWKWKQGVNAALPTDFGIPAGGGTNSYSFCVYDQAGAIPVLKLGAKLTPDNTCGPAGDQSCWKSLTKGGSYKKKTGNADGIVSAKFKAGEAGKPAVEAKMVNGALDHLRLPFSQSPSVIVQLQSRDPDRCWGSSFVPSKTKSNFTGTFIAAAP